MKEKVFRLSEKFAKYKRGTVPTCYGYCKAREALFLHQPAVVYTVEVMIIELLLSSSYSTMTTWHTAALGPDMAAVAGSHFSWLLVIHSVLACWV